ncbi:hypothetical protein LCGC14_2157650 [marine sediment metagenome]|uniref:Uncharacterized protein n=1 Tax=marine sediment metagenome TaxID=412755 RepID=A0A0F9DTV5_9ZZZZ
MEYTKGEWKVTTWHTQYPSKEIRIYSDDGLIATMEGKTTLPQEANAHLIAAAPDVYEALERTLFDLKNGFLGDSPLVSDRVGEIEKVLAKADEK